VIHTTYLIQVFCEFFKAPQVAEFDNPSGGHYSNCLMLEPINLCQEIVGGGLKWTYAEQNRIGDHIWWISDNSKFLNIIQSGS
jgi:CDP-paratose 2-epimerase